MSTIQVLKPKFHIDECLEQIRECLEKGWTGSGFKTAEFEQKWKEYTGHPHACYLNSNTSGLHLATNILKRRYGWQDGDEIITTPVTFVSTNHAILYENLKPVFADVDQYLCLDPADVEKKITGKTRAVIFVGYGGRVGQLDKVLEICKQHGLHLILDAAHMSGTRVNGVTPGTWEGVDVAVYSYQAVKNLPTGDSGMICFADGDVFCLDGHTFLYVGTDAVKAKYPDSNGDSVSASYQERSPGVGNDASDIINRMNGQDWIGRGEYQVFRCVKPDHSTTYTNAGSAS